jgi:hypothetical protein
MILAYRGRNQLKSIALSLGILATISGVLTMALWKGYTDENLPGTAFGYSFALFVVGYCLMLIACFLFYEAVPDGKEPLFTPDKIHKMALYAFIVAIIGFLLTAVGSGLPQWGTTESAIIAPATTPSFEGRLGLYQYCYLQRGVAPNPDQEGCVTIDQSCKTQTLATPPQDLTLRECPRLNGVRGLSVLSVLIGVAAVAGFFYGYFKDSARGKFVGFVTSSIASLCAYIAMGVWLQYFERNLESGGNAQFPFPNPGLGPAFGLHVGGAIFYTIAAMMGFFSQGAGGQGQGQAQGERQASSQPGGSPA